MYEHADKAHKDIEKNGCHIIYIPANEAQPSVAYSIGIAKTTKHPDIVVTGLDKDTAHFLINEYNYRIRDGESFDVEQHYDEFLQDAKITFRTIAKEYYESLCPQAQWFYEGDDFTMLHLIWPDENGALPWEKKASKSYRWLMPRLYQN